MLIPLLFAISMATPNPARAAIDDSPLPADVPRVRRGFDPLRSQEGFIFGQRSIFGANRPAGFDTSYPGTLQLGNGLNTNTQDTSNERNQLNDSRCEADYLQQMDSQTGNTSAIEALRAEMNSRCLVDAARWNFNILDSSLADRYEKTASAAKGRFVVVYFKRMINRLAGSWETTEPRVWTSNTTNYVMKFWNPSVDLYKPPRFYSKYTGESDLSGTDSFGAWFHRTLTENQANFVMGFVVRASVDNVLLKTYDIVVQDTMQSGGLMQLSVDSKRVFDNIVLGMLSGKPMKINYIGLRSIFYGLSTLIGYNTDLRVISVESLDAKPN